MVAKIAAEIDRNHSHKAIAAITFTIKAAQEIKDRNHQKFSYSHHWLTTLLSQPYGSVLLLANMQQDCFHSNIRTIYCVKFRSSHFLNRLWKGKFHSPCECYREFLCALRIKLP